MSAWRVAVGGTGKANYIRLPRSPQSENGIRLISFMGSFRESNLGEGRYKLDKQELKDAVCTAIEQRSEEITALGEYLWKNPELGYKEVKAAAAVEEKFRALGLEYRKGLARTGLKAKLKGRTEGPTVAVLGELDAVVCFDHPDADTTTGAAHCCGHNAQVAMMIGVAMGIVDAKANEYLDGNIVFLAVPAEEYVEIDFRQRMRIDGKIRFLGGKQELLHLGEFDDIDMAMMCHSESETLGRIIRVPGEGTGSNGFVGKSIRYVGKEAHAGGMPHYGINALNAAVLGLMGIHANRETFKDADAIRVHPIITKGGELVNIVPADVRMETYVRGRSMEAIMDASKKVNRSLEAGALAVGAKVEIDEIPGYLPLQNNQDMARLFRANAAAIVGSDNVEDARFMSGSTDMGDITHILPGIHPSIGGIQGSVHARDYMIVDPHMAYIVPAKVMAMTVIDLLWGSAEAARQVVANFKPVTSKEGYFAMWENLLGGTKQ